MGRSPCCDDNVGLKKGPWTTEEDKKLSDFVNKHGHGSWRALPKLAGLNRCGKSCRLRWANYLRPDIKRGKFSDEEEQIIIKLHSVLGNKWSTIAQRLPGRTDNEIKNYWNTNLRKKLLQRGIDPVTHRPRTDHLNLLASLPQLLATSSFNTHMINPLNNLLGFQNTDFAQLAKAQMLQSIFQVLSTPINPLSNVLEPLHHPLYNNFDQNDYSFGGLENFTDNFAPNQTMSISNSSSLDVYPNFQLAQTTIESDVFSGDYKVDNNDRLQAIWPTQDNTLPGLVSNSPECSIMNEMENLKTKNTDMHDPSSSSTTFDAWGELEGCEVSETYWKEILDQVSYPSANFLNNIAS